ncbi:MAG: cyclase family protein [Candidatus Pacebacteria bacterium]|nr:cyclase family protein [Candidatus Paceibacterota bacterium]
MHQIIDLTHTITPDIPGWDGDCGFAIKQVLDYSDCEEPYLFRKHDVATPSGIGTHMDSPAHCLPGGKTIEQLSLENLVTDCVLIRVDDVADENYIVMPSVVEEFEKKHGEIKENAFVIFYTGWDKYWGDKEKYNNDHTFPSVHEDTAKLLLDRNIAGLGIDTLSADTGKNGFPVHKTILEAGKYLVENIAQAGELPPTGAKIAVLPMKIKGAAEAPIRLIAFI